MLVLRVIVKAVRCIRRTETALRMIAAEQKLDGNVARMLTHEMCRQRAEDMPVRERLTQLLEHDYWFIGTQATVETRETLMTLLMKLVALDDRTEILRERIMEEQNKKGD